MNGSSVASRHTLSVEEVLANVRQWPTAKRVRLLQQIAATFSEEKTSSDKSIRPVALADIWALLPADRVQLTDAELDQLKEQWRLEKYG
jgi:hypothetical protein